MAKIQINTSARTSTGRLHHWVLMPVGLMLLALFSSWWVANAWQNRLVHAEWTWVQPCTILGGDFLHNYRATCAWQAGLNPYREPHGNPGNEFFMYPPVVLRLFSWCRFFDERTAILLWIGALIVVAGAGTVASWKTRQHLGLWDLPLPFLLAAVLCSFPMTFALERGNCDLMVLLLIVLSAPQLRHGSLWRDGFAGVCLALATWIKIYPGLLLLGLLTLRRRRALASFALTFAGIWLSDPRGVRLFRENMTWYAGSYPWGIATGGHSLSTWWKHLWAGSWWSPLAEIPGLVGAAAALLPLALWVSFRTGVPQSMPPNPKS